LIRSLIGSGMRIKRGDLLLVNLEPSFGSEQGRIRPVVVVQNNIFNKYSPTLIVVPVTSKVYSKVYPSNVFIEAGKFGMKKDSTILTNQIRVIDKGRVLKRLGVLDGYFMRKVDLALRVSLGL
jgi:mRNA interferase MazF